MTGSDAPQAQAPQPAAAAGNNDAQPPAAGTVDVTPYLDLLARDPTFLNRLLDAAQQQQTGNTPSPPPAGPAMAQPSPQDRALPAVPAAIASASPPGQPPTTDADDDWPCQWTGCTQRFTDSDGLLQHLDADHIGRKKLGNLCLECKWVQPDGQVCGVTKTKRDHITSHLRVHIRAQPHVCEICQRRFKRDYDLRKHERSHTAESSTNRGVAADESSCTPSLFKQMEKKMTDQFKALLQSHFRSSGSTGSSRSMSSKGSSSSASSTTSPSPAAHATSTGAASAMGMQYAQNDGLAELLGPAVGVPAITATPPGSSMSPMNLGGMGYTSTTSPMAHVSPPMVVSPYGSSSTTTTKSMSPANLGTKRPALDDLDQFLEDIKRQRVAPVYDETLMAALDTLPPVPTDDPLLDMDPTSLSTVLAYLDTLDANMMLDAELANLLTTDPLLVGIPPPIGFPPTYATATAPFGSAPPPPPSGIFPPGIAQAPPPFAAPGTMLGIDSAAAAAAAAAMYGYAPPPAPMPMPMAAPMMPPMSGMAPPQLPPRPSAAFAPGYMSYAPTAPPAPYGYTPTNPYATPPYAAVAAPSYMHPGARSSSGTPSSSSKATDYEDEKGAMVLGNVKPEDRRAARRAKREARRAARSAERSGKSAPPPSGEQPSLRQAARALGRMMVPVVPPARAHANPYAGASAPAAAVPQVVTEMVPQTATETVVVQQQAPQVMLAPPALKSRAGSVRSDVSSAISDTDSELAVAMGKVSIKDRGELRRKAEHWAKVRRLRMALAQAHAARIGAADGKRRM
ncbi:hypothetical protein AMAG_04556 [Allomyces macrogynus ATCC 38327]|uniref:C2H2-type domain-containing protein n=1 Tax=Allomyces macrogynus (strain ATCC 38327) TaxID=578462 RepID=A0A0L0S5A9_ALLM3|nr:hypothetical protein AMAG_04556 [Allomyces macrogynus ATCC 38327]|eukprot:KNE57697.1 hypothetical protein AMAG_04556 [Allomyces macrogynus ATCC 38327]